MDTPKPYMIRCAGCRTKNRIPADKINSRPVCGKCRKPMDLAGVLETRPVEVSDSTFQARVLDSPIAVLAFFWAPWCTVCQSVMPTVSRIASGLSGRVRVAKINIDQNPQTASRFQVMSVPFMIAFDSGAEKDSLAGAVPELDILKMLAPYY